MPQHMIARAHAAGLLALAFGSVAPTQAAEITVESTATGPWNEVIHPLRCNLRLVGEIDPGDAERLATALDSLPDGHAILCLDSPGGSFTEGVEIAKLLRERRKGTWIEPGASCLSACAVAFMGGTEDFPEVGALPWRVLSTAGSLGFHAPSLELDLPPGNWPPEMVSAAYASAIGGLGDLVSTFATRTQRDQGYWFDPTLLAAMLSTPPDDMMMVDTVGEARLWNVYVATPESTGKGLYPDASFGPPDPLLAVTLCSNLLARETRMLENADHWTFAYERTAEGLDAAVSTFGFQETGCILTVTQDAAFSGQVTMYDDMNNPKVHHVRDIDRYPAAGLLDRIGTPSADTRVCYEPIGEAEVFAHRCTFELQADTRAIHQILTLADGTRRTLSFAHDGSDGMFRGQLDGQTANIQITPGPRGLTLCAEVPDGGGALCLRMPL